MQQPDCFVLMPYENSRRDRSTTDLDFDDLYRRLILPAVEAAGLRAIRADQELQGGIFHKTMFERLATCEYAVADLSLANPNVYYELGIRHALRPWSTVLIFQEDLQLPLDVALDSAMTYQRRVLQDDGVLEEARRQLTARLLAAETRHTDSPVFQLVAGLRTHEVDHRRADVLIESAARDSRVVRDILEAERTGAAALTRMREDLGDLRRASPEVVVTLMMSFRAQERWADMIETLEAADPELSEVWVVKEQTALALGRLERFSAAVRILDELLHKRPNSETYGLLGGIYKRQWRAAVRERRTPAFARSIRLRAATTYRLGFECDWTDPYPGVNALMLQALDGHGPSFSDPLQGAVLYAVTRRLERADPEYWDFACGLELAVLASDEARVAELLPDLLVRMEQPFQKTSTMTDLTELRSAWPDNSPPAWLDDVLAEVAQR